MSISNPIETWIKTEQTALESLRRANQWLSQFYSQTSKTFHIQFTDEDIVDDEAELHTATYHISANILDHQPHFLSSSELADWQVITELINAFLKELNTGALKNVLPLKNFGLLPIFSTCYRAELISYMQQPLIRPEYAVTIRRILYALFRRQSAKRSYPQKIDKLHPFLLYRCTKSLVKLRSLITEATPEDVQTFIDNLINEKILTSELNKIKKEIHYEKSVLERIYGLGVKGKPFSSEVLKNIAEGGQPGKPLTHILEWIEDASVNAAFEEIAKSKQNSLRADPSSLSYRRKLCMSG
jgi:hypothetical protein